MPESTLRFIRRSAEFLDRGKVNDLRPRLRGIYVLYRLGTGKEKRYDVCYLGMATTGGIKGRLRSHKGSKRKQNEWTHFSVFEVWDNVTNREIAELEGLPSIGGQYSFNVFSKSGHVAA